MSLTASHIMLIKVLTDTAMAAMATIREVDNLSEEEAQKRTKIEENRTEKLDEILDNH